MRTKRRFETQNGSGRAKEERVQGSAEGTLLSRFTINRRALARLRISVRVPGTIASTDPPRSLTAVAVSESDVPCGFCVSLRSGGMACHFSSDVGAGSGDGGGGQAIPG